MKTYITPQTTILTTTPSAIICTSVRGNALQGGDFGIGDMYIL